MGGAYSNLCLSSNMALKEFALSYPLAQYQRPLSYAAFIALGGSTNCGLKMILNLDASWAVCGEGATSDGMVLKGAFPHVQR